MKKLLSGFVFIIVCLIISPVQCSAQTKQDSIKSRIETIDGNEYIGVILERSVDKIKLKTEKLGEIYILTKDIKRVADVSAIQRKDGSYWLDNPQSTRYLWAPNGYNLKQGEGYYQNVWVLFNQAVYGLTDRFSAGIGVMPTFLFAATQTPVWITLKYSVPVVKEKINLGGGALMGTIIGGSGYAGILYGISTLGTKDRNISLGLGWGFANGQMATTPTVNINAAIRTGAKGYLITENYFIGTPTNFMVLSMIGGRRIIKTFGIDYGAMVPLGGNVENFVVIPWLGFTVPFGQKKTDFKK